MQKSFIHHLPFIHQVSASLSTIINILVKEYKWIVVWRLWYSVQSSYKTPNLCPREAAYLPEKRVLSAKRCFCSTQEKTTNDHKSLFFLLGPGLLQILLQGVGLSGLGKISCIGSFSTSSCALSKVFRALHLLCNSILERKGGLSLSDLCCSLLPLPLIPCKAAFLLAQSRFWTFFHGGHAELASMHQKWLSKSPLTNLCLAYSGILLSLPPPPVVRPPNRAGHQSGPTSPTGLLGITFYLSEYPFIHPKVRNLGDLTLEKQLCLCGCTVSTGCLKFRRRRGHCPLLGGHDAANFLPRLHTCPMQNINHCLLPSPGLMGLACLNILHCQCRLSLLLFLPIHGFLLLRE